MQASGTCDVSIRIRRGAISMGMFTRILVAYDGSAGSERALGLAIQLAGEQLGLLLILSIVEHLPRFAGTVGDGG
jgi:nucleotide-binding universal stress UspA family protein